MNPAQAFLVAMVKLYRLTLSPALGAICGPRAGCRFQPTCSAYAMEAIEHHGAMHGGWLTAKRVCRCHPWGGFGLDPVPPVKSF